MASTKETSSKSKMPIARLYVVTGSEEKPVWQSVGAAWRHKDGKGYTLKFDAYPVGGECVMRRIEEKDGGQQ